MKPITKAACRRKIAHYSRLASMLLVNGYIEESKAASILRRMYEQALAELDGLGDLPSKLEQLS